MLVRYERLPDLLGALTRAVVFKPALLSASELVYLRRSLDLPQSDLADILGCTVQTLSLWERGAHSIPRSTDTLLRRHYIDEATAVFGRNVRAHRVSELARLAKVSAGYLYEGSFSGHTWSFAHRPTPRLSARDQTTGVAVVQNVGTSLSRSRLPMNTLRAVGHAQVTRLNTYGGGGTWEQPSTRWKASLNSLVVKHSA